MNSGLTAFRPTSGLLALAVLMSVPAVTAVSRSTDAGRVDARPSLVAASTSISPQLDARSVTTRSLKVAPHQRHRLDHLKRTADGGLGSVNLADQNNTNAGRVMAAALVYARTGSSAYRTKVVKQLAAVPHARLGNARVLSVGRQVAGYAIAADLVDYQSPHFRRWMSEHPHPVHRQPRTLGADQPDQLGHRQQLGRVGDGEPRRGRRLPRQDQGPGEGGPGLPWFLATGRPTTASTAPATSTAPGCAARPAAGSRSTRLAAAASPARSSRTSAAAPVTSRG